MSKDRGIEVNKTIAKSETIDKSIDALQGMHFPRLIVLSDVIDRYVDVALKDEVNWLRMRALIILTMMGKGSMTPSELARNLLRPNQNITKLLDGLERDGFVTKRRGAKDRRVITVRITHAGVSYIEHSLKKIDLAENELHSCLNKAELDTIASIARKIMRHFIGLFEGLDSGRQTRTR
jgi:DNA-binding MarR family transcriptional regulator